MTATWVEVGRAIYSIGLLLLGGATLFFLPVALRVVRDLTVALASFTSVLGSVTAASEHQREQLELTRAIADRLGVRAEVPRRASPRPPPSGDAPEIGDPLP